MGHEPPLGTAAKVAEEYEVRREAIAETLANELSRCVKISLTFYNCFVEVGEAWLGPLIPAPCSCSPLLLPAACSCSPLLLPAACSLLPLAAA